MEVVREETGEEEKTGYIIEGDKNCPGSLFRLYCSASCCIVTVVLPVWVVYSFIFAASLLVSIHV